MQYQINFCSVPGNDPRHVIGELEEALPRAKQPHFGLWYLFIFFPRLH